MATRMQQRRGTAAQWISTNGGAGPVLNAGEMGWESDTNKFKIGDGVNNWTSLDYFSDINSTVNPAFGSSITFEGATANDFETTLAITDPTADRTITFPDATGTVVLADGSGNVTVSGDLTVSGTTTTINSTTINATTGIIFEGLTADAHETTLTVTDPTADRTITFPDATGTVQLRVTDVSDTEIGYLNGVTSAIQTQLDAKSTESKTETLTNKSISLGSNTVTSTLAQLNTAISDADVATLTGTETLTNKTLTTPVISSITNGAATLTLPTSTGTIALTSDIAAGIVTETGTQTLTNKTLTSPVVSGLTLSDSGIVIEGSSADAHETTLTVTNPTADRTITFPDETGTVQLRVADVSDTEIGYLNGVTSAIQTQLDDKSTASKTETLTNKTLTTPTINGPTITATGQTPTIHGIYLPSPHNIIFEGTTADEFETTLQAGEPTADRTITLPDGTGTLALAANVAALSGATFTGAVSGTDLTLSGNLTVNGTTTNINSTNLVVEDKNIVLADVETPTDTTADGGGITLKGATDKTFNWVDSTDSWTSSEHINLASGKSYSMNGTALKDVSETLSNKTLASAVATTALTLNATAELRLADTDSSHYVGFKAPGTVSTNRIWTLPAADGTSGQTLSTDGSGALSWSTPAAGAAFSEMMLIGA